MGQIKGSSCSIALMAEAVCELATSKRRGLINLEEMTYRQGITPGPDLAFAGVRIVVARSEDAASFLLTLAPHEVELRAWLAVRDANPQQCAATPAPI